MASRQQRRRNTRKSGRLRAFVRNLPAVLVWGWSIWILAVVATLAVIFAPPLESVKRSVVAIFVSETTEGTVTSAEQPSAVRIPVKVSVNNEESDSDLQAEAGGLETKPNNHRRQAVEVASSAVAVGKRDETSDLNPAVAPRMEKLISVTSVRPPTESEDGNIQKTPPTETDKQLENNTSGATDKEADDTLTEPAAEIEAPRIPPEQPATVSAAAVSAPAEADQPDKQQITETKEVPTTSTLSTMSENSHTSLENTEKIAVEPSVSSGEKEPAATASEDDIVRKPVTPSQTADIAGTTSRDNQDKDSRFPSQQTASGPERTGAAEPETVPFRTVDSHNRELGWERIGFEGRDKQDKPVQMELLVLSDEYFWIFGGLSITDRNGLHLDLREHLASASMKNILEKSQGVVCIGTASEEGNRRLEEIRAAERADLLSHWIIDTQPDINTVYALGLGQYQKRDVPETEKAPSSEEQRRIILINIISNPENADLSTAIRNGLDSLKPLPFKLQRFSTFDFRNRSSLI